MFEFLLFLQFILEPKKVRKLTISLVVIAALLGFGAPSAQAQDDVLAGISYSPYSLFGFGDLVRPGTTYNATMGGIGIGDRNVRYINIVNPAGVTARELKSFMVDFGLDNRNTLYQGNAATSISPTATGVLRSASNTFNMHHLVISLPISTKGAFKVGVMPYSVVNYDFKAQETSDELVSELGEITYTRTGRGGVYKAFLGAGVTLFNRLSLGADFNYYFGKIERHSNATFDTDVSFRAISSGWDDNVSCFGGKVGLQYSQPLTRALGAVIGVTYDFNTKLRGSQTRFAYAESTNGIDTVIFRNYSLENYRIPGEIGAGISLRYADQWMVGFDYTYSNWSNIDFGGYPGVDFTTGAAQSFRGGFELTPNRYDVRSGFGHFLRRITYRGGVYHERSYMHLNGSPVASTGLTLGFGIPVFRYYNSINFGIDMGQRGTLKNDLIRERYFLITISFNLHDIWFIKPLYN
jgi:hypothetical protein